MREYILFPSKLVSYFVSKCKIGGECSELMFVRDRERKKRADLHLVSVTCSALFHFRGNIGQLLADLLSQRVCSGCIAVLVGAIDLVPLWRLTTLLWYVLISQVFGKVILALMYGTLLALSLIDTVPGEVLCRRFLMNALTHHE